MTKFQALRLSLYTLIIAVAVLGWIFYINHSINTTPDYPANPNLFVSSPQANQIVTLPIEIRGAGSVFADIISISIEDSAGHSLYSDFFKADSAAPSGPAGFSYWIQGLSGIPVDDNLIVKLFWEDINGVIYDLVSLPLVLDLSNAVTIDVFYSLNNGTTDCTAVAPLSRVIPKNGFPAQTALLLLLSHSLTATETELGYFDNLPGGVALNSLTITDGLARVDFSSALNEAAGSCRVLAIRSQIEHTLRQFRAINDILITAAGEVTLQP